ncbi:unnamed protein product [Triticum turgidum subsp. durum]|uniref:ENTH domain-containing protein n=1 Tax=Triticum turgidum subsp. durum TaxID=4567 RepID=A0A9R1QJU3_TRITD|nr:unnamed protein product [Triticum turgidum subsp. durum]
MSALQSWRKAYGALKDTTTVSLASLNSDFRWCCRDCGGFVHRQAPSGRRLLHPRACPPPHQDPELDRKHWKTLVVIHRLLRDGDPTFREELLNFTQRVQILQLSNFKDNSSPIAWDYSSWVRTYGLFLEERLQCFRILKYDIEAERLPKQGQGSEKGTQSNQRIRFSGLAGADAGTSAVTISTYWMPGAEGAANTNYLVQYALAINDGIINLVYVVF